MKILKGREGFLDFCQYVLQVTKQDSEQFLVSNVDKSLFDFWLGGKADEYNSKIAKITNLSYKVLIKQGDFNFVASQYTEYGQYKWMDGTSFTNIPFYIFGDYMAMILFDEKAEVSIYLIDDKNLINAQKSIFLKNWDNALVVPHAQHPRN